VNFFLLSEKEHKISDHLDQCSKPCYEQQALYRRFDFIREVVDSMTTMGWKPLAVDHEDANGQFEVNWEYDDCLISADRHAFFKFMAKSLAEKHGFRATFMPKPFGDQTGTGTHIHVSLHKLGNEENLFKGDGALGMSDLAYHFMGGVITNADSTCSLYCPVVNSYKRLAPAIPRSGSTWSPNTITYTGNNRTHMIRIPAPGRFELRIPDGAVNPYLLPAVTLALGLWGISNKVDPGIRCDFNLYTTPSDSPLLKDVKRLPTSLVDAVRVAKANPLLGELLGDDFMSFFLNLQLQSWNEYMGLVSAWEVQTTLNC